MIQYFDTATFRRALLLLLLHLYLIICAVTALQAAAQLEVACADLCLLLDEHLSNDRPVYQFLAWPGGGCCWLRLLNRCYTFSRHIAT